MWYTYFYLRKLSEYLLLHCVIPRSLHVLKLLFSPTNPQLTWTIFLSQVALLLSIRAVRNLYPHVWKWVLFWSIGIKKWFELLISTGPCPCVSCLYAVTSLCHLYYLETSGEVCGNHGEEQDSIPPTEWVCDAGVDGHPTVLLSSTLNHVACEISCFIVFEVIIVNSHRLHSERQSSSVCHP